MSSEMPGSMDWNIEAPMKESRDIQNRLPKKGKRQEKQLSCSFFNLMFQGKTQKALDLLSHEARGDLLHLSDLVNHNDLTSQTVKDVLKDKHPMAHAISPEALIHGEPLKTNQIIFDAIDASVKRLCALSTKCTAGPSGLNVSAWQRPQCQCLAKAKHFF